MKKRHVGKGFFPWHPKYRLEKYNDSKLDREPDEVIEFEGNLMMNAGINQMLDLLIGTVVTDFDDPDGHLGVGSGSAAVAASQTDLQGASTARVAVASPTRSSQTLTFVATFGSAVANFAWEEVGIFNASSGGVMLTRRLSSLGTKASGATWVLTITLAVS
jgi:hypothetical protein